MSEGEQLIADFGKEMAESLRRPVAVRLDFLRAWLEGQRSDKRYMETPETIARVLRGCGLYISKKQFRTRKEGDRTKFKVVSNFELPEEASWSGDPKKEEIGVEILELGPAKILDQIVY